MYVRRESRDLLMFILKNVLSIGNLLVESVDVS